MKQLIYMILSIIKVKHTITIDSENDLNTNYFKPRLKFISNMNILSIYSIIFELLKEN